MLSLILGTDVIVISSHQYGSREVRTSALMDQMALGRKVYFINKPIIGMTKTNKFFYTKEANKVTVVQPYLAEEDGQEASLIKHLRTLLQDERLKHVSFWTDTAQGEVMVNQLDPKVTVYDGSEQFLGCDIVLGQSLPTEQVMKEIEVLSAEQKTPQVFEESSESVVWLNNHFIDETKSVRRSFDTVITRYQQMTGN